MTDANDKAPKILDLPIALDAAGMRREFDSLGDVEVPANRYWGAQTQRSLEHFNIGNDRMPKEVYHAYGYVKKAAARVNTQAGRLPAWKGQLIERVCDEVIGGALDEDFPLYVWQTGSGTQSNMNVNEVISNRCIQLVGGTLGSQQPIHPNDHVNMGQSSNDTFPIAMHIAAHKMATEKTIPALKRLRDACERNSRKWADVVKIGRTHLEDATPLTVGQEWSGYVGALDDAIAEVEHATGGLLKVTMGGTAVGTGLNAPAGFGEQVAAQISSMTGAAFETAPNKFTAQGTLDRMVRAHAGLKAAAVTLFKIANDLRWLGSGPRTGIHELLLPANEPGSSIMPGKVNPTQTEATLPDRFVLEPGVESPFGPETFTFYASTACVRAGDARVEEFSRDTIRQHEALGARRDERFDFENLALARLNLAMALLQAKRPEPREAARVGIQALAVPRHLQTDPIKRRAHELLSAFSLGPGWATLPAVKELAEVTRSYRPMVLPAPGSRPALGTS